MTLPLKAQHLIGGRWLGDAHRQVLSPRNREELVGLLPEGDADTVAAAVDAAAQAQPAWQQLGAVARGNVLHAIAARLEAHVDELGRLAALEMGKPIGEALGEARRAVAIFRYYAGEGLRPNGEVIPASHAATLQYTRRVPMGVVGLITPWNFPLAIPAWKIAPALIYGNAVVWKAADLSSLTAYRLAQILAEDLPAGVFNLVHGPGRVVGEALSRHAGVAGVSFTGSSATGGRIAAACSERGAKFQLEMGGKNPVVVCDDANLDAALDLVVSGAMRSAGQKCTATSRVITLPGVYDTFRQALVERVQGLAVGDPLSADTYVGPVSSPEQERIVLDLIEAGRSEGATMACGGGKAGGDLAGGCYVQPTVFEEMTPQMTIAQEEIFGPVVGLMRAPDLDAALEMANGVRYGLSASIFTSSLDTAMYASERLEAGMVRVNEETAGVELQAPFGGLKASSSHSREQGQAARAFYTHTQTVAIRPSR